MTLSKRIILVVALQTLVLLAMIGFRQWTLTTGTIITLEAAPVDPRSLFSGDYVNFAYKISSITLPESFSHTLKKNQTVYVVLTPQDNFWIVKSLEETKPKDISSPDVVIKGQISQVYNNKVWVTYGIESYFIPEGKGKELEKLQQFSSLLSDSQAQSLQGLTVKVAVDRFGNAAIDGLYFNNEQLYQEKLL